jgi:hypothetical protein
MDWIHLAQDRVKQQAFVYSTMYISTKISPVLHMHYSESMKKVSNRFGADSDLESVLDVTIIQKVEMKSDVFLFKTKNLNCVHILDTS